MYIFTATVSEDLIGFTITTMLIEVRGRKHEHIAETTWLLEAPEDRRARIAAEVKRKLLASESELSEFLRRVVTGVSSSD